MPSRLTRLCGSALLGVSLAAAAAHGQAPGQSDRELFDQVRRAEEVAAQKFEADLRESLQAARRLAASEPSKAAESLKTLLSRLESDTTLSAGRRESLTRMLKDQIRILENDAKAGEAKKPPQPTRKALDARDEEQKAISRALKVIAELQDHGHMADAHREAVDLLRKYPDNLAVRTAERNARTASGAAGGARAKGERERNLAGAYRDIDRSATPTAGDMDFPKDWKERTKGRSASVQLSEKEKQILKGLSSTISVRFRDSKLQDVIEYLHTATGLPIVVDDAALKAVEASYDTPVTGDLKGVTVRTALRKIFNTLNMTYVIKDEAIQITSFERAKEMMIVRRYYIGDLLGNFGGVNLPVTPPLAPINLLNPGQGNAIAAAQAQNEAAMKVAAEALIEMIQSNVDPASWKFNGGNGTITFHPQTMSLLIKQSAEVHSYLGSGLK